MLVTILIPTHNRPAYLRRAAEFYSAVYLHGIRIHVVDSSDGDSALENARTAERFRHVMDYRPAPNVAFYDKIEQALESLPSDFVVVSADDDFHNPTACVEAAEFLHNNPDFAVAHGRAFSAHETAGHCDLHPYHQNGVVAATAAARMSWHLGHYCPTFYSVHRKQQTISNMRLARTHATEEKFGELLPSCASLVAGKSKLLDTPFMLRQGGNQATSSDSRIPWESYIAMERFARDYAAFAAALADEIARSDRVPAAEAEAAVDRASAVFLQRFPSADFRSQAPERIRRFYPSRLSKLRRALFGDRARQRTVQSTHVLPADRFSEAALGDTLRQAMRLIAKHPFGIAV